MVEKIEREIKQESLDGFRHGGLREGAGRPNLSGRPAHLKRPELEGKVCANIHFVLVEEIPNLRKPTLFKNFKKALSLSALKGWKILHYALKSNSVSLLVECDNNNMLESCTKSFGTSLSKRLNLIHKRSGPAFKGRYRIDLISDPLHLKSIVKSHYTPKKPYAEDARFYMSWNSTQELLQEEALENTLRGPSIPWLKQSFKVS